MPSDTWSFVPAAGSLEKAFVHQHRLYSQALVHVCTHMLLATHSEHAQSHTQSPNLTQPDLGVGAPTPGKALSLFRSQREREKRKDVPDLSDSLGCVA